MYHRSQHFQFSISFEESKELGMEVNWAEGLKDKLVRSGVSLFGKDVKKKKKKTAGTSSPKQSGGDWLGLITNLTG